jgi:hypothetical protein
MREELLHYIWRYRHFNQQGLVTEDGRPLHIVFPGQPNTDQGPDFRAAQLRIGEVTFVGPVELHIRSSDWLRHGHTGDAHYREVILHVVWENDTPGPPADIPILVLHDRVSKPLLGRYEHWMRQTGFVPCERQLPALTADAWRDWTRKLTLRRLQRRAVIVGSWLDQNRQDWEETTWWMMARSMGLPVNAAVFEAVARSLPLRLLKRHRLYASTLEALLLGQAGLLQAGHGLHREYEFWRSKYGLQPIRLPVSFLRMRPGHSPVTRLVQLAALQKEGKGWFGIIREATSAEVAVGALAGPKGLGIGMRRGIVINAFVPLLFAYGQKEKALAWLEELPGEQNHVIRSWAASGVVAGDAAASQGMLELKKEYCNARRCLDCAIGRALLNIAA